MRTSFNGSICFAILLVSVVTAGTAQGQVSSKQFEAAALPALEVEESYDFLRQHAEGLPPGLEIPTRVLAQMRSKSTQAGASRSPPTPRPPWSPRAKSFSVI